MPSRKLCLALPRVKPCSISSRPSWITILRTGLRPSTRRSMRAPIRARWRVRSLSICAVSCSFKWATPIKSKPRRMSRSRCRRTPSPFRRAMSCA
ncbi:MAG: hypothetical protein MZV64_19155 [Ignavibacteriales bacterium]|nr:hypothetical protein [Ignavibacteriales bacterium]